MLRYLERYNAIVCTHCHCAYPYDGLDPHLAQKHRVRKRLRDAMIAALPNEAQQARGNNSLTIPEMGLVPVVRELAPPQDGLCCAQCRYCCLTANAMGKHRRKAHPSAVLNGERHKTAKLQSFYRYIPHLRYFPVETEYGHESLVTQIVAETEAITTRAPRSAESNVIRRTDGDGCLDEWNRATRWDVVLDSVQKSDLAEFYRVAAQASLARSDECQSPEERLFRVVGAACARLLQRQYAFMADTITVLDRRALNQPAGFVYLGLKITPTQMEKSAYTLKKYQRVWVLFLQFVCGVERFGRLSAGSRLLYVMSAGQRALLDGVLAAVDNANADEVVEEAVRRFIESVVLCHVPASQSGEQVLHAFLGVLGFSARTGSWHTPYDYASLLTALLYGVQLQCYWRAHHVSEHQVAMKHEFSRWSCGDPRTDYLRAMVRRYASTECRCPLARVLALNWTARQLVSCMVPRSVLAWSGADCLMVGEERYSMGDLQQLGIRVLRLAEGELCRQALFLGAVADGDPIDLDSDHAARVLNQLLPREQMLALSDNLMANAEIVRPLQRMLSTRMLRRDDQVSRFMQAYVQADRVHVAPDAARRYRARLEKFVSVLAVAVHLLGGMPPHASELVGPRFRNLDTQRRVFVHQGRVLLVSPHHNDAQSEVSRLLPVRLSRIVLVYLLATTKIGQWLQSRASSESNVIKAPEADMDGDSDASSVSSDEGSCEFRDLQDRPVRTPTYFDALFSSGRESGMSWRRYHSRFERVVRQACGQRLRVTQWRHIFKAVGQRLGLDEVAQFRQGFSGQAVPLIPGGDQHRLMVLDACDGYCRVSNAWQRFLGVSGDVGA